MEIHKTTVAPGERTMIRIPVGRIPSGGQVKMIARVFRSEAPGPTLLLLAGLHGDEVNGVEILRQALASGLFHQLRKGAVIVIPVANPYGFVHGIRGVPDGKDVNRSFPGNRGGSLAARTAKILSAKILPLMDFGIDFHTGGSQHYNYPQIRFTANDEEAHHLAMQFSAPFALAKRAIASSLRKASGKLGKPLLVFEGGENGRYDNLAIAQGLAGIQRLLQAQQMLQADTPQTGSVELFDSVWVRATRSGMFKWIKNAGQRVREGETLGTINDPYGEESRPVIAPCPGFLLGHNNAAVVHQGDALFHLGY